MSIRSTNFIHLHRSKSASSLILPRISKKKYKTLSPSSSFHTMAYKTTTNTNNKRTKSYISRIHCTQLQMQKETTKKNGHFLMSICDILPEEMMLSTLQYLLPSERAYIARTNHLIYELSKESAQHSFFEKFGNIPPKKLSHHQIVGILQNVYLAQTDFEKAKKIFCWASSKGYLKFIRSISKKENLQCLNGKLDFRASAFSHCMTPFYLSCRQGHIAVIKYFILRKCKLNELCSSYAHTISHIAAMKGYLNVLIAICTLSKVHKLRWDIDKRENMHYHTPLTVAVINGHFECCQYLVQNGANVHVLDKNEMSLLYYAAQNGHFEICELLLKNGININGQSKAGKSALFIACDVGHFGVAKILIKYGANIGLKSSRGKLPLYVAAEKGFKKIVRLLLEQSKVSDLFTLTSYGTTAFFIASKQSDKSIKALFKRFCVQKQQQKNVKHQQQKTLLSCDNVNKVNKEISLSSQQRLIGQEETDKIVKKQRCQSAKYRNKQKNEEKIMKKSKSEKRVWMESNYQRLPTPLFAHEMEDFNDARTEQMMFQRNSFKNVRNGNENLFVHGQKKKLKKNESHRYYKKAIKTKTKRERMWR